MIVRSTSDEIEFLGFERHLLTPKRPWTGLAASLVAHSTAACLLWTGAFYVQTRDGNPPLEVSVREATSVYVQLRDVPLRFHFTPNQNTVGSPANVSPANVSPANVSRAKLIAPVLENVQPVKTAEAGGASAATARRFELPPVRHRPEVEQTLLQPDVSPDVLLSAKVRLPEFVFWSRELQKAPARRKLIIPGRKDPTIEQPVLTAEPTLALPVSEGINSGVAKLASVLNANANLKVPPAGSAPVRIFKPPPQRTAAPASSIDLLPGDPSAIVALHPNPAPADPLVVVPGGNQIGKLPANSGDEGKVTARLNGANAAGAGTGPGNAASSATSSAGGSRTGVSAESTIPAGSSTGSVTGTAHAPFTPFRRTHPDTGVFDVVIAHPIPPPDGPGGKALLKGTPVYTVYLNVGKQIEWILRYCVPDSGPRTSAGGNVVQLGNPAPVTPPYPRMTVVPSTEGSRDKIAVLHGFLTAKGQFRSLEAVFAEDRPLLARMEPLLSQWSFRPAARDGAAIEIEILLLVPRPVEVIARSVSGSESSR